MDFRDKDHYESSAIEISLAKEEQKANFFRDKYPDFSTKTKPKLRMMKPKTNSTSTGNYFIKKTKIKKKVKRSCDTSERRNSKTGNKSIGPKKLTNSKISTSKQNIHKKVESKKTKHLRKYFKDQIKSGERMKLNILTPTYEKEIKFPARNTTKHNDPRNIPKNDNSKFESSRKTDGSHKNSKLSTMPFPLTMQVAEQKIQGISNLSNLFSPISNKKHKKSIDSSAKSKKSKKVYESPITKNLHSSNKRACPTDNKFEPIRGSVSSIKPSKGDTDTESLIRLRFLRKNY